MSTLADTAANLSEFAQQTARAGFGALAKKYGTSRDGHAMFAPSAAAGWLNCSGFLLANATRPDTAGVDAAYGTVAHKVAEIWHKEGREPRHLLGYLRPAYAGGERHEILVDEDMLAHVGRFVQWCAEVPGDHFYEQRVDLSPVMPIPGQGGTADHIACERGRLTITDLKMGTGVRVYAERNPQAMLYALGALYEYDWIYAFQEIVIRICQPRLDVFDAWTCSRAELMDFADYVRDRAELAWAENAPRAPSPKACRWCAATADCAARLLELNKIVDDTFGDLAEGDRGTTEYPGGELGSKAVLWASLAKVGDNVRPLAREVPKLSTAALSYTLTLRSHVENLFAGIAAELLARAEGGEDVPHFKLADARTRRAWKDAGQAADLVGVIYGVGEDKAAPRKTLSPAKMEKMVAAETKEKPAAVKRALGSFVMARSGKRTLAPLKDDRPDVAESMAELFEAEEDEDEED